MSEAVVESCAPAQNGEKIEAEVVEEEDVIEEEVVEVEEVHEESEQNPVAESSEAMPALEIPNVEDDSRGSTPSEGNTPRDYDTSSSSASPVPDDTDCPKRKVNLGRDISLMMQALNSLHSPEEKLAALCKKYADLLEQQKVKDKRLRGLERKLLQATREKDQIQKELNKAVLGKSRMESLARELNKQNKVLKEESYNLTVNHNKEREQVSAKFQAATDEISGKINAIADRNEVLNDQNKEMSEKIAKLLEETVTREKMVKKMMEQRDLQAQILELKLKKAEEERDSAVEDGKTLQVQIEKSAELSANHEKELKSQIAFYSKKVAMFQSTLDKSNQVFSTFRSEMDGMSKKVKTLEKATETWKKGYEKSNAENQKLQAESAAKTDTIGLLNTKVEKLTKLSRALQAERNELAKSSEKSVTKTVEATKSEATTTVNESPADQVKGEPDGQESPNCTSKLVDNEAEAVSQKVNQDGSDVCENVVSTTTPQESSCDNVSEVQPVSKANEEEVVSSNAMEIDTEHVNPTESEHQGHSQSPDLHPVIQESSVKAEADSSSDVSVQESSLTEDKSASSDA